MIDSGQEPDRLWRQIADQKRQARPKRLHRSESEVYSHDAMQTWVQMVAASLSAENSRPIKMRSARHRMKMAILQTSHDRPPLMKTRSGRQGAGIPVHASARLILALVILAVLTLGLAGHRFRNARQPSHGTSSHAQTMNRSDCQ